MKVWQIPSFGIENVEQIDRPMPEPERGQVAIKVQAVSLNYRDLLVTMGKYNQRLALPRIPCSDGVGEIVALGADVTRWKIGQRVAGIFMQNWIEGPPSAAKQRGALGGDIDGMLAEYVALDEHGLEEIPPHLSWEEAATLPCAGVTAWNAVVHAGRIKPGDTVVIQGTGGVSIFALQFAKLMGARVLGTSSSDEKLRRAQTLGLDSGVNYRQTPDWASWVLEHTGGVGADLVVEVGGSGTLMQSLKAIRIGGVVAQIGVLSQAAEPVTVIPILHKQVHLNGIYVGSRADFEEMNRAIVLHSMQPAVDEVFAFSDFKQALRTMESASHFGKLAIRVNS
jgi:NADPH:quinone reductase-like Zn-dependent oxidoreductase